MKRVCDECNKYLPPGTEHFVIDNIEYCTDCVEAKRYIAYQYFISGDFVGDSETGEVEHVEDYEDLYEED